MALYHQIEELVGNTPLVSLDRLCHTLGLSATILAKAEYFNPASSIKDRVALHMLLTAEQNGLLKKGTVIIEPTSGNTGIGLAAIGSARGYRVMIVMPDSMSIERQRLMRAYGAEVILTPGVHGMKGAIAKAEELAKGIPDAWIPGQFENPANPEAHYLTTGPEIWKDTAGKVDLFVAGIGTGGTISGTGRYLKEQNPAIRIVGVEPASSPLLTEGHAGAHGLQGIGANFIPDTYDRTVANEIITVKDTDAYETGRTLAACEGLLVGITAGAAVYAAITLAKRPENQGKTIVAVLPDTGEHYLSTAMFAEV